MAKSAARSSKKAAVKDPAPPGRFGGSDFLHVLLIGIIAGAIFTGIAVGASYAIGVKPVVNVPTTPGAGGTPSTTDNGDGGQQVVIAPTEIPATPTPTEIPCEKETWWSTNREATNQAVAAITDLSINTSPGQITAAADQFSAWSTALESVETPPCLAAVKDALVAFAPKGEAYIEALRSVTTSAQRGQALLDALTALQPAGTALTDLGGVVDPAQDAWVEAVNQFFTGDCLAGKWYVEIMVAKDYLRFLTTQRNSQVQSASLSDNQNTLRDIRDLNGAFEVDRANFPECVSTAAEHFKAAMSAFVNGVNSLLNQDAASASTQLSSAGAEVATYSSELDRLLPAGETFPSVLAAGN